MNFSSVYHTIQCIDKKIYITGNLVLTGVGETCQTLGLEVVGTSDECIAGIGFFQAHYKDIKLKNEEQNPNYPNGCYAFVKETEHYGIYFNTDSSGAPEPHSRALCKIRKGKN